METRSTQLPEEFNSLLELVQYFDNEHKAHYYIQQKRWGGKPICPHCQHGIIYRFKDGKRFKCQKCSKKFTVRMGTIFEGSKVPLTKWLIALHLHTAHKKGISSHQLARDIKVTQKTAWFMLHRIRYGLGYDNKTDKGNGQFTGVVEVDETFVGGKNKNRHKDKKFKYGKDRYFEDKVPILGLFCDGKVKTVVIKDTSLKVIKPYMRWNIRIGTIVVTDEWRSYKHLSRFYHHETVRHDLGRYVSRDTGFTTNNIEGFWNWVKRMIMGVYHVVSKKHLQFYANEATFRFNTRTLNDGSRLVKALALINHPIKYKELISR